jgi:hypothetical protein
MYGPRERGAKRAFPRRGSEMTELGSIRTWADEEARRR